MTRPESLERLRQLAAKVDAFFAWVEARHGAANARRSYRNREVGAVRFPGGYNPSLEHIPS